MYEKARDTAVGAAAAAGEGAQNLKDRVMGPSTGTGTGMGYSSGTHTGTGTGYSSGTGTGTGIGTGTGTGTGYTSGTHTGTGTGYSTGTGTGYGTGTGTGTGTGYGTGHTVRPCMSSGCRSAVLGPVLRMTSLGTSLACTGTRSLAWHLVRFVLCRLFASFEWAVLAHAGGPDHVREGARHGCGRRGRGWRGRAEPQGPRHGAQHRHGHRLQLGDPHRDGHWLQLGHRHRHRHRHGLRHHWALGASLQVAWLSVGGAGACFDSTSLKRELACTWARSLACAAGQVFCDAWLASFERALLARAGGPDHV